MTDLVAATIDYADRGQVRIVENGAALAREAATALTMAIERAIARSGRAAVALSGGSTPKLMGDVLTDPTHRGEVQWDRVEIFWGDERWVPPDSPESNAGEAIRGFLRKVHVPGSAIHAFETVGLTPEESASRYAGTIRGIVAIEDGLPAFDLVLLGMGDDGHTASLFPGTAAIHEKREWVTAHEVPKLEATRLTLTPPVINNARQVVFLVGGAGKAGRLAEVLDGPVDVDRLPSQVVRPRSGDLIWLVDRAAAADLAREAVPAHG